MRKRIRQGWQRNGIAAVLFTGLFALPLAIHALAI
jgi:hypothetical protein